MIDQANAQKALDKTKMELMASPDTVFFTVVAFSMTHRFDDSIPTARTNGKTVRYNTDFFMSLTGEERLFLMLHETMHIVFQHILRLNERDPKKWNRAGDYIINNMLIDRGFVMPKGGLSDPKYKDWTTDQVYDDLEDDETFEMDMETPPGNLEEFKENLDDILIQASIQTKAANQDLALLPQELREYLDSLLTPKLPWDRLLARFMNDMVKVDYSYRKPNRRFFPEHILPTANSHGLEHIAIIIDTSGSISTQQFHQFLSDTYFVLKQFRPKKLTVVQFGSDIVGEDTLYSAQDLANVRYVNGGGTNIHAVIEWAKTNKPNGMIVLTDGLFSKQYEDPKIPTIWAIHSYYERFRSLFGKVVEYKF